MGPNRGAASIERALDALWMGLHWKQVNYVLDADIRSFFDTIEHDWIMRFLERRIADRRVLRLIHKWLTAGVVEAGRTTRSRMGTPQGAVISPLLANIYLHYVYDLWTHRWRRRHAGGEVIVVRYADDGVVGFQVPADAWRFLGALRTRLAKFGLTLNEEKTRIVEFGRFAMRRRANRGQRRPETDLCGGRRATAVLPRPIELLQGGLNFIERAYCRSGLPHPTLPPTEKGSFPCPYGRRIEDEGKFMTALSVALDLDEHHRVGVQVDGRHLR